MFQDVFYLVRMYAKIMLCFEYVSIRLASVPAQLLTLKSVQQQQTGHMLIDFNMLYLLMLCLCKALSIFISWRFNNLSIKFVTIHICRRGKGCFKIFYVVRIYAKQCALWFTMSSVCSALTRKTIIHRRITDLFMSVTVHICRRGKGCFKMSFNLLKKYAKQCALS